MRTFAQKPEATQQTTSARPAMTGRAHVGQSRDENSVLYLQRTIGNQTAMGLLQTNAMAVEGNSTAIGLAHLSSQAGSHAFADRGLAKSRPKDGGEEKPASPAPAPGVSPPNPPAPMAPKPAVARPASPKHVKPTFILDKKEDPRSNSKPSTQSKSPPTFVGDVVGDGKVWHYELKSVESKGKIRIVYFTDDHYPAPTPTDDSGALSNVTKTNWKTIVDDLEKNKAGIPDFWSSYKAEDVHENYHWEVEWQGEMKKELLKAEGDIAKLSLGVDKAPAAADAKKVLEPQATTLFNEAMKRADTSYQALPDSAGAPAYKAQIPVVTALKKRVSDHAKANKW